MSWVPVEGSGADPGEPELCQGDCGGDELVMLLPGCGMKELCCHFDFFQPLETRQGHLCLCPAHPSTSTQLSRCPLTPRAGQAPCCPPQPQVQPRGAAGGPAFTPRGWSCLELPGRFGHPLLLQINGCAGKKIEAIILSSHPLYPPTSTT